MTKEDRFVVNPLIRWFKEQKADWTLHKPSHGTSATGWDIEASRNKQDLLIEAKYIAGPALASFAGLVTAPLAKRAQHSMVRKYRSWCHGVCWAIGIEPTRNMYQILFDYMARNPKFWKHYGEDLRMKYIFFVHEGEVTRISFTAFLRKTKLYGDRADGKTLGVKRGIAEDLMSPCLKRAASAATHI
jgi:hypothetical protein